MPLQDWRIHFGCRLPLEPTCMATNQPLICEILLNIALHGSDDSRSTLGDIHIARQSLFIGRAVFREGFYTV